MSSSAPPPGVANAPLMDTLESTRMSFVSHTSKFTLYTREARYQQNLALLDVIDWVRTTTGTTECPRNLPGTTISPPTTTPPSPGTTPPPPPPPPPTTASTTTPNSGCATVSGDDPGKTCIFPFRFQGVLYNACTFDHNTPGDTEPWCSTSTNANDDHDNGQGKWGFCDASCPVASTTSAPTTTPRTCRNEASDRLCQRRCRSSKRCRRKNFCKRNCNDTCGQC